MYIVHYARPCSKSSIIQQTIRSHAVQLIETLVCCFGEVGVCREPREYGDIGQLEKTQRIQLVEEQEN